MMQWLMILWNRISWQAKLLLLLLVVFIPFFSFRYAENYFVWHDTSFRIYSCGGVSFQKPIKISVRPMSETILEECENPDEIQLTLAADHVAYLPFFEKKKYAVTVSTDGMKIFLLRPFHSLFGIQGPSVYKVISIPQIEKRKIIEMSLKNLREKK